MNTIVKNNIADVANGGAKYHTVNGKKEKMFEIMINENGRPKKVVQMYDVAGKEVQNNIFNQDPNDCKIGLEIDDYLEDADNYDFRPIRNGEADNDEVGPYTRSSRNYWIPGRQLYKASSPVPPHQASSVKKQSRTALMWLNGYGCSTHHVYFGTSQDAVGSADEGSDEYLGSTERGDNVMKLDAKTLVGGEIYFWRVDAVTENGDV